ncbi:nucleotidyltransferase family protein [Rossellomorea aquimaris]|uniref:nucleotidyltransferase family protein n=1 Tax=Rossellomorea aquimaris TaxID=189382 RepID=UPI003CEBC238
MLKNKEDVIKLIENDPGMMEIIKTASLLDLPDWWICAGFVRSKIWDTLHGYKERTHTQDVDVIYFDEENCDEEIEKRLEAELRSIMPLIPWSVKNEARMHVVNDLPPYTSSEDAISKFPETATALGVKMDKEGQLVLTAPCGLDDVINLEVKPTSFFRETEELVSIYEERIRKKNWKGTWPVIIVHHIKKGE